MLLNIARWASDPFHLCLTILIAQADVQFSCLEQARFGACDMPFMTETQEEISEGVLRVTKSYLLSNSVPPTHLCCA